MNNEFEGIETKAAMAEFKLFSHKVSVVTDTTMKIYHYNRQAYYSDHFHSAIK
jgi:hypothetical protein